MNKCEESKKIFLDIQQKYILEKNLEVLSTKSLANKLLKYRSTRAIKTKPIIIKFSKEKNRIMV